MRVREITEVFGLSGMGKKTQRQRDAATWKAQLKARQNAKQATSDVKTRLQHGIERLASDGETYRLDVGRGGDMIWFNVRTGAEADTAIDRELMT